MFKDKRIGKFKVTLWAINTISDVLKKILFSKMIIIRCEQMMEHKCIEYTAISDLFDEVKKGEAIPEYEMEIEEEVSRPLLITKRIN